MLEAPRSKQFGVYIDTQSQPSRDDSDGVDHSGEFEEHHIIIQYHHLDRPVWCSKNQYKILVSNSYI